MIAMENIKFGRLTVKEFSHRRGSEKMYRCVCDCGAIRIVAAQSLKRGDTKSCGCFTKDRLTKSNTYHGMAYTREYKAWRAMLNRCYLKADIGFHRYGGRGITVCDEWRNSFEAFFDSMGPRPTRFHSIDRIDVDGNYEPGNCRWATRRIQDNNTSKTFYVEFRGETKSLTNWCRDLSLNAPTVWARIKKYNWPIDRALSTKTGRFNGRPTI